MTANQEKIGLEAEKIVLQALNSPDADKEIKSLFKYCSSSDPTRAPENATYSQEICNILKNLDLQDTKPNITVSPKPVNKLKKEPPLLGR